MLVGGIEAGGTKFVCGIGNNGEVLDRISFPTTSPQETISRAVEYFKDKQLSALGVAPLDQWTLTKIVLHTVILKILPK